jgi:hypothetical protein
MRKQLMCSAAMVLAAATAPVYADLQVTEVLPAAPSSTVYNLSGSTVGKPNNASIYTSVSNTTGVAWDRGEYVYQFTLTKEAFLYLTDSAEPDTGVLTPAPNHDYFLLNSLTTFPTDNTNAYFFETGKPEATSLAFVQESMGPTTAGSSANAGIFRSAATNPYGIYGPGTYYLSVDARGLTTNTQNEGNFFANLNVKYLDEVTTPAATQAQITPGGQITGSYSPGSVEFFSFEYTSGAFTITTEGNTLPTSDTFLALYDSRGALVMFNDDTPIPGGPFSNGWSTLEVADGQLEPGTYYLGFVEYKGEANSGFDLRVFPGSEGASGTFVINGLSEVPEPASLGILSLGALALLRRRK